MRAFDYHITVLLLLTESIGLTESSSHSLTRALDYDAVQVVLVLVKAFHELFMALVNESVRL